MGTEVYFADYFSVKSIYMQGDLASFTAFYANIHALSAAAEVDVFPCSPVAVVYLAQMFAVATFFHAFYSHMATHHACLCGIYLFERIQWSTSSL